AKLSKPTSDYLERLVAALSHGVLAVLSDGLLSEAKLYLSMLDYPIVSVEMLEACEHDTSSIIDCALQTHQCAQRLQMRSRGAIRLGAAADLLLVERAADFDGSAPLSVADLHRVIVGGNVAWQQGELVDASAGTLMHRPLTRK
ncbi:MAG: hypothetical protein AAGD11_15595, partial [Planctomycetota bacterium]